MGQSQLIEQASKTVGRCFPAAVFGKPPKSGPIPRAYGMLSCNPALVSDAGIIQQIAEGFRWQPVEGGQGRACFGLWRNGDRSIVLRILDAGRDDQGRPHSMRVEACLTETNTDIAALACFLNATAWPDGPADPSSDLTIQLVPASPPAPLSVKLIELYSTPNLVGILIGKPTEFQNTCFDKILDETTCEVASSHRRVAEPLAELKPALGVLYNGGSPAVYPPQIIPGRSPVGKLVVSTLGCILLLTLAGGGWYINELRVHLNDSSVRAKTLVTQVDERDKAMSGLKDSNDDLRSQLSQSNSHLDASERLCQQWQDAAKIVPGTVKNPADLKTWIANEQQNNREKYDQASIMRIESVNSKLIQLLKDLKTKINADLPPDEQTPPSNATTQNSPNQPNP